MISADEAVRGHRQMWTYIYKCLQEGDSRSITSMKYDYCKSNNLSLVNDCFICEYMTSHHFSSCEEGCLFNWGDCESEKFTPCYFGLFYKSMSIEDEEERLNVVRQISELQVRSR